MANWMSVRSMARHAGVSKSAVQQLWARNDLKPHRTRTFKISRDPLFAPKFWDVIGLYLEPLQKALVLCCNEPSAAIQPAYFSSKKKRAHGAGWRRAGGGEAVARVAAGRRQVSLPNAIEPRSGPPPTSTTKSTGNTSSCCKASACSIRRTSSDDRHRGRGSAGRRASLLAPAADARDS